LPISWSKYDVRVVHRGEHFPGIGLEPENENDALCLNQSEILPRGFGKKD
jgi:hypothetical protein